MSAAGRGRPIRSVWARPGGGRARPALSREHIVAEAVLLLDAEGLEALSMRRLGARLNSGATSLYSHVAGRDELVELVVDAVHGETLVPAAAGPGDWREAAADCARSLRATLLRHPWAVPLLGGAAFSCLGPHRLRITEGLLAVFASGGFPLDEADRAVRALLAYVTGTVTGEAALLTALARSGCGRREWNDGFRPVVAAAVRPHPLLSARFASQQAGGGDEFEAAAEAFGYGLDRMLDGLAARADRSVRPDRGGGAGDSSAAQA